MLHYDTGNTPLSLKILLESLTLSETVNTDGSLDGNIVHILNNLAQAAYKMQDLQSTLSYLERSEKLAANSHNGLGINVIQRLRGRIEFDQGKYEAAAEYFSRSLEISQKIQISQDEGYAARWLARVALAQNDFMTALKWADHAWVIFERLGMAHDLDLIRELKDNIQKATND
jgi:tetratricopeptide (TPR) repeat protein